jgi:hypothetical protein
MHLCICAGTEHTGSCKSCCTPFNRKALLHLAGVRHGTCCCVTVTHHNCSRTVLSSKYMVFDRKSIPIVA